MVRSLTYMLLLGARVAIYNIGSGEQHVVQLNVPKQLYRLGDDVIVALDFSHAFVPCYQVGFGHRR